MQTSFPDDVSGLFWDVDPGGVDLTRHRDYVIERVMTWGPWSAMRWLRQTYPPEDLVDFLTRRSGRLTPRDLAYWSLVCEAHLPIPTGGGRPSWAGP